MVILAFLETCLMVDWYGTFLLAHSTCPSQVDIVPGAQEVEGIGLVGWHHSVCLKMEKSL
jgi:hypothetical protein